MTTDIRSRLVDRLRAVLNEKTANLPDSIPLAVPVGPLVDAVIDEMTDGAGVPVVPPYDHEVAMARRWTEPFTQEEVMDGGTVRSLSVYLELTNDRVMFVAREGKSDTEVSLPLDDAEEFLLAALAALAAGRAARIDEPTLRG